jgi:D-alanyl-D-alanine carboxypeptidase/D-alanyl-D-alanine-endopeptidase (penicillin-binding protein 4)
MYPVKTLKQWAVFFFYYLRHSGFVSVLLLSGFVLGLVGGCGPKPSAFGPLTAEDRFREEVDRILDDPAFATAYWGIVVQSLKTGEYLYLRNPHRGFMPASNMKLFTTAVALEKLGPDFRYTTFLLADGKVENGVLKGNLLIRGTGDPSLTGRYHDDDPLAVFRQWADSLKSAGIDSIDGRIIGDDNYFEDEIMGTGWSWDYQSDWYAAQISALSFNDNCVDVFLEPGDQPGSPARFFLRPDTRYVHVKNEVKTVRHGLGTAIFFDRRRGTNFVRMFGTIELDRKGFWDWFSVENPTLYTAFVFREVLLHCGIGVRGAAVDIDSLAGYAVPDSIWVVARYFSPPLREIVRTINKVSQNLYAELLLRTLGKIYKDVGDAAHGAEVVKEHLGRWGIDPGQFKMADGSGLSRLNMVTPLQISILLRKMRNNPYFFDSLPIAGVDGTIKNRMKGTAAEGNVHAKTGYIGRVRALSGYVTSADGEEFSFVFLVNNYTVPTPRANWVQDWLCERLANFRRIPSF